MDELTYDIIEDLATEGLIIKYGEARGKAIAFLFFGKYGLLGLTDVAILVSNANNSKNASGELTAEMAANLVMDMVSELVVFGLSKAGVTIFERLANPLTVLSILFSPKKLGNGELPIELRPEFNEEGGGEQDGSQGTTDQGGRYEDGGYGGYDDEGSNSKEDGHKDDEGSIGEKGNGQGSTGEGEGGDFMEIGTKDAETGGTIEPIEPYGPVIEEDGDWDEGGGDEGGGGDAKKR